MSILIASLVGRQPHHSPTHASTTPPCTGWHHATPPCCNPHTPPLMRTQSIRAMYYQGFAVQSALCASAQGTSRPWRRPCPWVAGATPRVAVRQLSSDSIFAALVIDVRVEMGICGPNFSSTNFGPPFGGVLGPIGLFAMVRKSRLAQGVSRRIRQGVSSGAALSPC